MMRRDGANERWAEVAATYDFRCVGCFDDESVLVKDHVRPWSLGGDDTDDNIQPLCATCNWAKGARSYDLRVSFEERFNRCDEYPVCQWDRMCRACRLMRHFPPDPLLSCPAIVAGANRRRGKPLSQRLLLKPRLVVPKVAKVRQTRATGRNWADERRAAAGRAGGLVTARKVSTKKARKRRASKGGKARAASLTPERRREIARAAAKARYGPR